MILYRHKDNIKRLIQGSEKKIMNNNLIVALDVADIYSAKKLVEQIGDRVNFYKIGLEFMMSGDFFNMVEWLKIKEKNLCRSKTLRHTTNS